MLILWSNVSGTSMELLLTQVSASSVRQPTEVPSLGIDGNRNIAAVSLATGSVGSTWMRYRFQRNVEVSKIVLMYMYAEGWFDPNFYCILNWNECLKFDSNVNISLGSKNEQTSCGIWNLKSGMQAEDQVYEFPCEAETEEILLSKPNNNIAVYELKVKLFGEYPKVFTYTRKSITHSVSLTEINGALSNLRTEI